MIPSRWFLFSATGMRLCVLLGLLFAEGSACGADDPPGPRLVRAWGHKGDQPGEFHSPVGIALAPAGEVIVTDLNNARVQRFSPEGEFRGSFDVPLDAPPRRSCILGGVVVDPEGQIFLSFMNQNKIAVYSPAGELVREWGVKGSGDGELWMPGGMVLTPGGDLWVADQCNHRVQQFTAQGEWRSRWGGHGTEPGRFGGSEPAGSRFGGPHFLARDRQGRFYTTEGVEGRVQQLAGDGRPLGAWGNKGDEPGGFGTYQFGGLKNTFGPVGVALDAFDRVYVSSLNDRVQVFTTDGRFLFGVGDTGEEPGHFHKPHGMAVDGQGRLYVADSGNQRIQVFQIPPP